jgi:signal transduction histidine kinase
VVWVIGLWLRSEMLLPKYQCCKSKHKRHSLFAKLVVLFLLLGFLFAILFGLAMKVSYKSSFDTAIQPHLIAYLDYVKNDIGLPPDLRQAKKLSEKLAVEILISGNTLQWASTGQDFSPKQFKLYKTFVRHGQSISFGEYQEKEFLVLNHGDYQLFFSVHFPHDWHIIKLLPFLVFIMVLFILYKATAYIFSPLKTIQNGIEQFSKGNLEHKIVVKRKDELADLAININAMGTSILQMLEAKRQLLLAISHELRSPLTRAKIQVEMLNEQQPRESLKQDLNEMAGLIEDLLEGERLNNHQGLNRQNLDMNALVLQLQQEVFAHSEIKFNLPTEPISFYADPTRLRLLLKNLLDNAIHYTPQGHLPAELKLWQDKHFLFIQIKDHGQGIAAEHLKHLGEPFYRADPARQRETGGYGLGLYLCEKIVAAHGGHLDISSEINKGTIVEIKLPLDENNTLT